VTVSRKGAAELSRLRYSTMRPSKGTRVVPPV
jgi:hypothetical protein